MLSSPSPCSASFSSPTLPTSLSPARPQETLSFSTRTTTVEPPLLQSNNRLRG
ncbi:hypothetical protein QQP08_001436 [Theobroma cacao]|nr:hypothetical protein QQP08_001436 [Theobroma cacao]